LIEISIIDYEYWCYENFGIDLQSSFVITFNFATRFIKRNSNSYYDASLYSMSNFNFSCKYSNCPQM